MDYAHEFYRYYNIRTLISVLFIHLEIQFHYGNLDAISIWWIQSHKWLTRISEKQTTIAVTL